MNPIILFGGSFDPIHEGHWLIGLTALTFLQGEKLIFIPSKSPNKTYFSTPKQRKRMLKLFLSERGTDADNVDVSFYELNQKHESVYTIDTIKHFQKKYPRRPLVFLIGEDKLDSLPNWKNIDEISRSVRLVCVPRGQNHSWDEAFLKKYHIEFLPIPCLDMSSHLIRSGKSFLTSKKVLDYIADHQLYFCGQIAAMEHEHRYRHSVSVAKTAYQVAIRNDLDPFVAYQAGLFHDCGKDLPLETQRDIVHRYFSEYEPLPDFALHQFVGAHLAKTKFGIQDDDVFQSIAFHCTGKGEMSPYQKLIYVADKAEPTRPYPTKKQRHACYQNLDSGFVKTLKEQKKYFLEKHISYTDHFLSKEMYSKYMGD